MGVLKDMYDIAKNDLQPKKLLKNIMTSKGSVARQASEGILQFPVITSRSLSNDVMQMTSKACERNFTSFLQVVFTMNQISTANSGTEYLRDFHRNTGVGDGEAQLKRNLDTRFTNNRAYESVDATASEKAKLMVILKEELIPFDAQFEMASINSKFIPKDVKQILEAKKPKNTTINNNVDVKVRPPRITITNNIPQSGNRRVPGQDPKDLLPQNILKDNDVKKCNELIPSLMHVRILHQDANGNDSKFIDFIVGVKATLHPVDSNDMIEHLVATLQDQGAFFKFIKWTTGEITLLKDLIFNVNAIKGEVKDTSSGKTSPWWALLKVMKSSNKFKSVATGEKGLLPNATLVVSAEEVDYIKANYGYDLLDEHTANRVMKEYNLLQFIVIDTGSEMAHFFIDGQSQYQSVTFNGLERENGNSEKQFKNILKAVNKL